MAASKTSIELSLPKARKVRGYTIDRMPIGRFLTAAQTIQDTPEALMRALFPEDDAGGVTKRFAALTKDGLRALVLRAFGVLPAFVLRLFAELSGIPEEKLRDDPTIGLDGLAEMLDAWMEVNGIEHFFVLAGALAGKARALTTGVGSKG